MPEKRSMPERTAANIKRLVYFERFFDPVAELVVDYVGGQDDLRRLRLEFQKIQTKRQTFDELIAEIRDLKTGAFAPLTEQPFVQAILFPGGGLGLLAVGQRLFDIF